MANIKIISARQNPSQSEYCDQNIKWFQNIMHQCQILNTFKWYSATTLQLNLNTSISAVTLPEVLYRTLTSTVTTGVYIQVSMDWNRDKKKLIVSKFYLIGVYPTGHWAMVQQRLFCKNIVTKCCHISLWSWERTQGDSHEDAPHDLAITIKTYSYLRERIIAIWLLLTQEDNRGRLKN